MYAFQNIHFILGSLGCFTCKRTSEDDTESLLKHCNGYSKYYYLTSFCCCYCCRCCSFWFRDTMCKFVLLWLYVVQHFINQLYSHSFTTVRYDIYGKALYFSPITSIIWHAFSVIMAHIIYYLFGTYANTKADSFFHSLSLSLTHFFPLLFHIYINLYIEQQCFFTNCSLGTHECFAFLIYFHSNSICPNAVFWKIIELCVCLVSFFDENTRTDSQYKAFYLCNIKTEISLFYKIIGGY